MKMKQSLEAIIESGGEKMYDEKYIIAEIIEKGQVKKVLVSMPIGYHSGIARAYEKRLKGKSKDMRVRGGGIIRIDKKAKKVSTYGKSGSYGKPDVSLVKKILYQTFPHYRIDAKVTDYVR